VCYFGWGTIFYGGIREWEFEDVSFMFGEGSEVKVEVELHKGLISFTVKGKM
jgi:hypothetical protein